MREIDLRESWNRLSARYQKTHAIRTDSAHYGPYAPDENRLGLLGDVQGKRILELGCGGGQCSIAFARQGAECVAVDLSDAQIAYARQLAAQEEAAITFVRSDMAAFLETLPESAFDIAFSAYAFQYVEDLGRVFRGTRRALKPGGLFVFSLDHPLNDITACENGRVYLSESYFARGRRYWNWDLPGSEERAPFYSFHRTVGDFLNLLTDAGFLVERLLEPEPTAEGHDPWEDPTEIERYAAIPATIIWKARVPG
jgi:SAM-dependent methyltransferase